MSSIRQITKSHRIRRLCTGHFIAEERIGFFRWKAVDMKNPSFLWEPNDRYFCDCIGDEAQALKTLALRGA